MSTIEEPGRSKKNDKKQRRLPVVKNVPRRTDGVTVYTAILHKGIKVKFDTCYNCKEHVVFCHCASPKPPAWLADEVATYETGRE